MISSRLFKPFMRYCGNNICRDKHGKPKSNSFANTVRWDEHHDPKKLNWTKTNHPYKFCLSITSGHETVQESSKHSSWNRCTAPQRLKKWSLKKTDSYVNIKACTKAINGVWAVLLIHQVFKQLHYFIKCNVPKLGKTATKQLEILTEFQLNNRRQKINLKSKCTGTESVRAAAQKPQISNEKSVDRTLTNRHIIHWRLPNRHWLCMLSHPIHWVYII